MKLVKSCSCAGNDGESSFHLCGGPVKLVYACLSAGKGRQSSFCHCGSLVMPV